MKDKLSRPVIHSNKKYMALFYDKCRTLDEEFEDAEIGAIIRASIRYELYGDRPELSDRALAIQCRAICDSIDVMTQRANKLSDINRDKALKRHDKSFGMTEAEIDAEIDAMFPRSKNT